MRASTAQSTPPPRGRKRFSSDLQDAARRCGDGWIVQSLRVDDISRGEDEGSILCEIVHASTYAHIMTLNVIVSDTSDYPDSHSFFCCTTSEGEIAPQLLSSVEAVSGEGHCSIEVLLQRLLNSCANQLLMGEKPTQSRHIASDDGDSLKDDDSYDGMDEYPDDDDDYGLEFISQKTGIDAPSLRRDFNEIVAYDYRPGLVRIAPSEIALSVSKPSFKLAESISPQALLAWDPRLLSSMNHLSLIISGIRGVYPACLADGTVDRRLNGITFRLGLTSGYKPHRELVLQLTRNFSLKEESVGDLPEAALSVHSNDGSNSSGNDGTDSCIEEQEAEESFSFSLSSSLEALINDRFLDLLQLRIKYGLGWAAAEALLSEVHRSQRKAEDVLENHIAEFQQADIEETELASTNRLPPDPFQAPQRKDSLNLPLIAFSYILRRLTLCNRYCLVCYDKLKTDFQALKPYVCDNKLCTYQYYNLNRGPSLEYEICEKPETVDLLISLAYSAASGGSLHGFPDGLDMQVPTPGPSIEFDALEAPQKNRAILDLLDMLPPVREMKKQLEKARKAGTRKLSLRDMNPKVPAAAWQLLRWCVASCTAHLEELSAPEDRVINVGPEWTQYRFTVGAPDAEAKFNAAQKLAKEQDWNAAVYPSLYAFHGSSTKNWHSIIRHGLWYKEVANGRAYGDGVYFAKDGTVSIQSYSRAGGATWAKSSIQVSTCVALAEIVNLPQQFRSSNPFFVVSQTDWIVCRYLLVSGIIRQNTSLPQPPEDLQIPVMNLDPKHSVTLNAKPIAFPQPGYKLDKLLCARREEFVEEPYDDDDLQVFSDQDAVEALPISVERAADDWTHDAVWVGSCIQHMLPPPSDATPMATTSVQRELARMMKEQELAKSLRDLGWYMPPDLVGDNLFQWIIELHSFDPKLPIAEDLRSRDINSIVFEILFPPTYPHSPPFFRILKPRLLPFAQGGGGHVTAGGSMCMDLLTADGWLPSYSISAVLLQIKLAISNLDPRPARLASTWNHPYSMHEAIEGYKRAAQTHGWKIPQGIEQFARGSTH
ncbi:hypothetical protein BC835DRAFT_1028647 [Cytidiella melzeri]|nr:hypothetical protein BC835DRAFT_1028647 [Cytidiella melzeri]